MPSKREAKHSRFRVKFPLDLGSYEGFIDNDYDNYANDDGDFDEEQIKLNLVNVKNV